ncbi:DUF6804 family protein [Maribacter sp. 4G9]|uniref:DUF6804 family protein n=1 Tax=Maribacter sp. 4G9 TaxID=1889777 RepID=UPI000C145198|nr:DUF6804 family protein [Maribacter sp. 4G9]PIB38302.1 hypothetical protein BFP75_17100 [Maribacter sp. 4G9]
MKVSTQKKIIRFIALISAIALFMALLNMPKQYYLVLRIIVFVGAIVVILENILKTYMVLIFSIILILFNPIFPIYLYEKILWMPLDFISGVLFLYVLNGRKNKSIEDDSAKPRKKNFERDRIV